MGKARKKLAPKPREWITTSEAARMLDCSRPGLLAMALRGEVESMQIAGRTVIRRGSVEKFLNAKQAAVSA